MKVYCLFAVHRLTDFVDKHGEDAGYVDVLVDIFESEELAKEDKILMEKEDEILDVEYYIKPITIVNEYNRYRSITYDEFHKLRDGDIVYVSLGDKVYKSKVINKPFYNHDADEPGWEVETTNGFSDMYSLKVRKLNEIIK